MLFGKTTSSRWINKIDIPSERRLEKAFQKMRTPSFHDICWETDNCFFRLFCFLINCKIFFSPRVVGVNWLCRVLPLEPEDQPDPVAGEGGGDVAGEGHGRALNGGNGHGRTWKIKEKNHWRVQQSHMSKGGNVPPPEGQKQVHSPVEEKWVPITWKKFILYSISSCTFCTVQVF